MQVIRCEHPDNLRPLYVLYDHGHSWDHLPNPYLAGIDKFVPGKHVCAAYRETLDDWFPAALRDALRSEGFRFVILDVSRAEHYCGNMQVILRREDAQVVGEYLQ